MDTNAGCQLVCSATALFRELKALEALIIIIIIIIIIQLYSVQHWRSDNNMCCSLWIILTY